MSLDLLHALMIFIDNLSSNYLILLCWRPACNVNVACDQTQGPIINENSPLPLHFSPKVHGYVSSSCGFLNSRIVGRYVTLCLANQTQNFPINAMLCLEVRPCARKRSPSDINF